MKITIITTNGPPQAIRIAMSLALLGLGIYGLDMEEGMSAAGGYKGGKD
jgi:hypothetical protein